MNAPLDYEQLRSRYRPDPLEVLLVGESPPAASGEAPFFYADHLGADNLFRAVAEVVLGLDRQILRQEPKAQVLSAFQKSGLWLIDTVDEPVNQLPMRERRQAVQGGVEQLVTRCVAEAPLAGVIVCHGLVYRYAADPLREAGVTLLHDEPLPFPSMGHRARFVAGLRAALSRAGVALAGVKGD
jgi:hypothetical protein